MKTCPICQVEHPDSDERCACGYEFQVAGKEKKHWHERSLLIAVLVILGIALGLTLKSRNIARHTNRLGRKIRTMQAANDSLQTIIRDMERTENYYYQMGLKNREQQRYEESNKFLLEKIKRFPRSNINATANELIARNNHDWAGLLLAEAKQACRKGDTARTARLADEIIHRFPDSDHAALARQLKQGTCGPGNK